MSAPANGWPHHTNHIHHVHCHGSLLFVSPLDLIHLLFHELLSYWLPEVISRIPFWLFMLGGNSRTGERAWYDLKAKADGRLQKERRGGDLEASVSHWPARQRVMRLVELRTGWDTQRSPSLHNVILDWVFCLFWAFSKDQGAGFWPESSEHIHGGNPCSYLPKEAD